MNNKLLHRKNTLLSWNNFSIRLDLKWTSGHANILGKINCNSGPHNESLSTAQIYTKQHVALLHFKHSTNQENLLNEV